MKKVSLVLLFYFLVGFGLKAQDAFERDVQLLAEYVNQGDTLNIKALYPKYEQLYSDAVEKGNEEMILRYAFVFSSICESCQDFQMDYDVANKGLSIAQKLYPKEYDLLAYFYQRLSISKLLANQPQEALKHSNKALAVSKQNKNNPSTYILSLSLSAKVHSELGNNTNAYKLIKEAYSNIDIVDEPGKKNICDRYLTVLCNLASEAAARGQVGKIEEYYAEAQFVLESNSKYVSAYILDDEFFNKIIEVKMQQGDLKGVIAMANARLSADWKEYEKLVSKNEDDFLSPADYFVAMSLSYASDAYNNNKLGVYNGYVETAYHNSQNPEVSLEYQSYAISSYASYAAYVKNDFKGAFDA